MEKVEFTIGFAVSDEITAKKIAVMMESVARNMYHMSRHLRSGDYQGEASKIVEDIREHGTYFIAMQDGDIPDSEIEQEFGYKRTQP